MPVEYSPRTEGKNAAMAAESEIDRIREIILGSSVNDVAAQLQQFDSRITAAMADMQDEFSRNLTALETRMNEVLDALRKDMLHAIEQGQAELARHATDAERQVSALESDLAEAREQLQNTSKDLHKAFDAQTKNLQERVQQGQNHLQEQLDQVHEQHVGRDDLASLLAEIGQRLKRTSAKE